MGSCIPQEAISGIRQLADSEDTVRRALDELRSKKSLGTVIFFDLVGSTGYRRRHKAEAGLQKAYLHNDTVSQAIIDAGGWVVKWMGDGVLGCFDEHICGQSHVMLAVGAALDVLERLEKLNKLRPLQRIAGSNPSDYSDHEIHTKISISSGPLHYFDLSTAVGKQGGISSRATLELGTTMLQGSSPSLPVSVPSQQYPLDPMGSSVDLASRLNGLAERGAILIDANTFWGYSPKNDEGQTYGEIRGLCNVSEDQITWRELKLLDVRKSVYLPEVAAFFFDRRMVKDNALTNADKTPPAVMTEERATAFTMSRMIGAGRDSISEKECLELVKKERNGHSDLSVIFAQRPVHCNVAGFESAVRVIALSLKPYVEPIKPSVHEWPDPMVVSKFENAERTFRKGDAKQAKSTYEDVINLDSRNSHALLRLAMLARDEKDNKKAMDYLTRAKQSNPNCALAWAVAGMVHIDDFARGNSSSESLSRAITGFSRAKQLAAKNFHGLLEQYSTCVLAIAHCLRHNSECFPDDDRLGRQFVEELNNWPSKNSVASFAHRLAVIFRDITKGDRGAVMVGEIENLLQEVDKKIEELKEPRISAPYDHMILLRDVRNLAAHAKYRVTID